MEKIKNLIRKLWNIDIIRFLLVGGINTIFGYSIYALGIFIGLHYSLATLFCIILGVLFNFKTTGVIVFKNSKNKHIFKFGMVYGIIYLVNVLLLTFFNTFGVNNYIGGAIIILPIAFLTFFLQKKLVFSKKFDE